MSSNKTITINPDLFKVSRKKREPSTTQLRFKSSGESSSTTSANKTLRKKQVLRYLREQQEKNFRNLLQHDTNVKIPEEEFNSDFHSSLRDLEAMLVDQPGSKNNQRQQTLRQRPSHNAWYDPLVDPNVSMVMPEAMLPASLPAWGCLKHGTLPTFRNWKQMTQRRDHVPQPFALPPPSVPQRRDHVPPPFASSTPSVPQRRDHVPQPFALSTPSVPQGLLPPVSLLPLPKQQSPVSPLLPPTFLGSQSGGQVQDLLRKHSEIRQIVTKTAAAQNTKLPRQQRTVRRTYKVGKSKHKPEVAVLVSNKTIRKNITSKVHEIKQSPIEDVKRFLTQKGFIRVGTSAPNDVLRKMYESALLMCGEIQNHNPDNVLFNFLNSDEGKSR
jgi:hypothetical protein